MDSLFGIQLVPIKVCYISNIICHSREKGDCSTAKKTFLKGIQLMFYFDSTLEVSHLCVYLLHFCSEDEAGPLLHKILSTYRILK